MKIRQMLLNKDKYSIKCPYEMKPTGITIHNTDNNASANNEVKYMISNNSNTGFHVAVDDIEAVQGIPFNRNAWHAGDGNGKGNRTTIGVEICYSTGDADKFRKAELNAIEVVKQLMKYFNIPIEEVKPHRHWSGKNCPSRTNMDWFLSKLKEDDEVVKKVKMQINGVIKEVNAIEKDGHNYVKLQDIKDHFIDVTYDSIKKIPVVEARA